MWYSSINKIYYGGIDGNRKSILILCPGLYFVISRRHKHWAAFALASHCPTQLTALLCGQYASGNSSVRVVGRTSRSVGSEAGALERALCQGRKRWAEVLLWLRIAQPN